MRCRLVHRHPTECAFASIVGADVTVAVSVLVAVPTPILGAGPQSAIAARTAPGALVSSHSKLCLLCPCRRRGAPLLHRNMRFPCDCGHHFHHQRWTSAGPCSYCRSPRLLASAKNLKRFEPKQLLVSEWHRRHQRRRLRHPKYSRVINITSKLRKASRMKIRNKYYVAYRFYSNFYRKHLNCINNI